MTPTIEQPPADCPNGGICIEDEIQRRRASDRGAWARWALGGVLSILSISTGWLLGRVNNHQDKIVQHDQQLTTLEKADVEIKALEKEKRDDDGQWRRRMEDKLDRVVEKVGRLR